MAKKDKTSPNEPPADKTPTRKASLPAGVMRLAGASAASGVGKQTIEYYILLGLISPLRLPGRTGRFFDDKLVRRIRLIKRLNRTGYTLRDIREVYLKRR